MPDLAMPAAMWPTPMEFLSIDDEARLRLGAWSERPPQCWRLSSLPVHAPLLIMRVRSANHSRWFHQHMGIRRDIVRMNSVSFEAVRERVLATLSFFSMWLSGCGIALNQPRVALNHEAGRKQYVEAVSRCLLRLRPGGFDVSISSADGINWASPAPVFAATRNAFHSQRSIVLWPGKRGQDIHGVSNLISAADANDREWGAKRNVAFFRGSPTGIVTHERPPHHQTPSRIHVLEEVRGDDLFDAKLSMQSKGQPSWNMTRVAIQWQMNVPQAEARALALLGGYADLSFQLSHKALVSIEGNGFATNLAWVLASNSVLVMPHGHKDEPDSAGGYQETISHLGLMPWHHFVPFSFNLTDVHHNVAWCFTNNVKCHRIAQRGRALQRRMLNHTRERLLQRLVLDRVAKWQCRDDFLSESDDLPVKMM